MDENTRALVAAQLAAAIIARSSGTTTPSDKFALSTFWKIERKIAEGGPPAELDK